MADAKRDENFVPTLLFTSNADGSTPLIAQADPATGSLKVDDDVTGSDLSGDNASFDKNFVPVFMAVSSVDGVTPVAVYADSVTGKILIKST